MTPTQTIERQDWMADRDLRSVFAALQTPGDPAPALMCVGGCVRDALMGRRVVDVDLATVHLPETTKARLADAGIDTLDIGIAHGTVVARFGHKLFQITTLRADVETDGRRATVAYIGDWAADAARRDFTMNALYADLDGDVYDPLGGAGDIAARRVRFIGSPHERIKEDALRILRFFRFHAQIEDGEIDTEGLVACRENAGALAGLSGERIRDEIFKLLATADPARTWGVMLEARVPLTELPALTRRERLAALVTVEGVAASADPVRRLAALVDDTDDDAARTAVCDSVADRLRLATVDRDRLRAMLSRARDLSPDLPEQDRKTRLYSIGDGGWRDAVLLDWATELSGGETGDRSRVEGWRDLFAFPESWRVPVLPVRGADVLAAGVPEGPAVSSLLKAVEDWWIGGGFAADRAACLAELTRRAGAG